ncbi:unnamed protein product [Vitrella brassicaformis CCMP3155]|uniref:U3 small nucleolar RNA-associated protein 13 C-terminal domain-containing protein n=3 Tax=Vitrella brassicaformis TaxID=1169539 RepID=A0A0G4GY15_VITBC|nr:unnamed protein product [Vitrella brassicaformis CCMP3155]|mmetsp:Transcript_28203/g.81268  ORF Transcript_28203/g.81268 Transcript_28203/m.81268 type:complete len:953 (-) Transcript_28203:238-3096(-)|eukprot:CEM35908.1 unnamed protein product [Vitrella brassicaformis CCMP3155]
MSQQQLSSLWQPVRSHHSFYSGGAVRYCEHAGVLVCQHSGSVVGVDLSTARPLFTLQAEGDDVLTFDVWGDGKRAGEVGVIGACRSLLIRHWSAAKDKTGGGWTSTLIRSWRGHDSYISAMCVSPKGTHVATGATDATVRVWDISGGFCTHNFTGHDNGVDLVRFHPSRQVVFSADSGGHIRIWDLHQNRQYGVLEGHLSSIASLDFHHPSPQTSGSALYLVTAARDRTILVWQEHTQPLTYRRAKDIPTYELNEAAVAMPTRAPPQKPPKSRRRGKREHVDGGENEGGGEEHGWVMEGVEETEWVVVSVGDGGTLKLWNPTKATCVKEVPGGHASGGAMTHLLRLDARHLLTVGQDLNVIVWSWPHLAPVKQLMAHCGEILACRLMVPLKPHTSPSPLSQQLDHIHCVCVTNDEQAKIMNLGSFDVTPLVGHTTIVWTVAVAPDVRWLATGGKDGEVRLWSVDVEGGGVKAACVAVLTGHGGPVNALAFPPKLGSDGKNIGDTLRLVSVSDDQTLKVWALPLKDVQARAGGSGAGPLKVSRAALSVVAHQKAVNDVAIAPNNQVAATAGRDKEIKYYSFPECRLLGVSRGHRKTVWNICFSPVDRVLASASGDGTARIWNLKDYTCVKTFQGHESPHGVLRVSFLSGGLQIMTCGTDGLVKLWNVRTTECNATFDQHEDKVWCMDLREDVMVTGGADSKIVIWRDDTEEEAEQKREEASEAALQETRLQTLEQQGRTLEALLIAVQLNRTAQARRLLEKEATRRLTANIQRAQHTAINRHRATQDESEAPPRRPADQDMADGTGGDEDEPMADQPAGPEADGGTESAGLRSMLQEMIREWPSHDIATFLEMLGEWSTNAKAAGLASAITNQILLAFTPDFLIKVPGFPQFASTYLSYVSRHKQRMEALIQKTFLLDLITGSDGPPLSGARGAERRGEVGESARTVAAMRFI